MENSVNVKTIRDASKSFVINKYKKIILDGKDLYSQEPTTMTKAEIKVLDKVLYILWNIGWLDVLEETEQKQRELDETKRLLEDSQKNYINTIEEHRKKNAYIEEYNKILRNLVYTQRQLILEYQKQLHIETIVDLYD